MRTHDAGPELPEGMEVDGPLPEGWERALTPGALALVADLTRTFRPRLEDLLACRRELQRELDEGERLDFSEATDCIREEGWSVEPPPADLRDRRVEITGPTDRKMVINALNSGANVFMADFEDSNAPTWRNMVEGQRNLRDAVEGTITYTAPDTRKEYRLVEQPAVLMVRPRGLHLLERHVRVDGRAVPAAFFDFAVYLAGNARRLVEKGSGPYFYLAKMEHHGEARMWNDVFVHAQEVVGLPRGTIKATCLIETLPAAFQMDEILWALREHSVGLNCGRWDYIFSYVKRLRADPALVLPDRGQVTMDKGFLRAYVQLLIKTCHRRGAHAMGGMAAQIPLKDPAANQAALEKVRADKIREVTDGHDGTWVAHPGLVPIAREIFDAHMRGPNQLDRRRDDVHVTARDLLRPVEGTRTEAGLRQNIRVSVQYLEAWLRGQGCVPLYGLMEDAATAEISRALAWQWMHHGVPLDDGRPLTVERFRGVVAEEMDRIRLEVGEARFGSGRFREARTLFERLATAAEFVEFLTLPAYELLEPNATAAPATLRVHGLTQRRITARARVRSRATAGPGSPATTPGPTSSACGARSASSTPSRASARSASGSSCTSARSCPRWVRSPATRRCRWCGQAWRPSTSPAGRWRRTRTPQARPTPTRASTPPTRSRRSSGGSTARSAAWTRSSAPRGARARTGTRPSSPTPRPGSAARSTPSSS